MQSGLIVGLGNPGSEYVYTRHNFGFMVVDALLAEFAPLNPASLVSSKKDPYTLHKITFGKMAWFFAKPLTFMNKSGLAVQHISSYYKIEPQSILVIHDELDLPIGKMKFKIGGGNAGHNGLKSIQQMLGTPDFYRLRLGIGAPKGFDTSSYVLGNFSTTEISIVNKMLAHIVETVRLFIEGDTKKAQILCNSFKLPEA